MNIFSMSRLSRQQYFFINIAMFFLYPFFISLLALLPGMESIKPTGYVAAIFQTLLLLPMPLYLIILVIRRLKDINVYTFFIVMIAIMLSLIPGYIAVSLSNGNGLQLFVESMYAFPFLLLVFAILCCIPGTRGPNRFGEDPLFVSTSTAPQQPEMPSLPVITTTS